MPTNFAKKKADRPERPESALDPVVALKKATGERSEEIEISRITIDQSLQVRSKGLDGPTVDKYRAVIQNGGELPPITLYRVQTDDAQSANIYLLAAGFHRIEAHKLEGRNTIFAVIRQGTREDAMIEAARSNLAHGLDLKVPDLRRALEILLVAGYYTKDGVLASNRVIAAELGITDPTAGEWIREIVTAKYLAVDLTRRWGKDGRVYEVENIQQAATQRAEEERKRKEQERFDAQIAAEEEKLARFRASNVIFRAKFIADMILHTPYNRNVATRLKIDLMPENTPDEQKTFGYYVKAADRRFTISTDRELQFIRDFKSNKGYHWYQDVLGSVTPAIWEQADAQNWTEEDMQQWLDGFKQRHSGPLPSAAPGMAQPKNPNIEIPQPKVLGRHRPEAAATEMEHRTEPTYNCPVRVGQRVKVIATGEITYVTAVEWVDVEWRLRTESDPDEYLLLSDVEIVVPPAPDELDTNPADCPFQVGQNVEVFETGDKGVVQRVTYVNDEWRINVLLYDGVHVFKADELQRIFAEVIEEAIEATPTPIHDDPAPCPFKVGDRVILKRNPTGINTVRAVRQLQDGTWQMTLVTEYGNEFYEPPASFVPACPFNKGDVLVYKPTREHMLLDGGQWNGSDWTLNLTNSQGHLFSDVASRFEPITAVIIEDKAVVPFRTGDILKDIQTGEYVEVVGFSSDGSITVQGEDGSEYQGQAGDFEKAAQVTPEQLAQASSKPPNGEYKPSNGTQTQMTTNYIALMNIITRFTNALHELEGFDLNIQYLQQPETLENIWQAIKSAGDLYTKVSEVVLERLTVMANTGLPYDPRLAEQTLKEGMQRA
ncbi:MAG: hypothetical protein BroJett018_16410 [Chloroflexota bacterium]|nr:hypothetical protein [Chloroflexota bacterium]NOG65674.1 ParB N-terminal domain-containing protein [Chloroflexota bacterium]GIK63847.1 MAG: hypothetical protein BroJett018_16410 [Chloroflexota bacterium]